MASISARSKQSVFFETKVLAHLDKGIPLDQFKVLSCRLTYASAVPSKKARLHAFTAGGDVIIKAGKGGAGNCGARRRRSNRASPQFGAARLRAGELTRKPDGQTLILHLLNYDHQTPAANVKVRLDLSGLVHDLSRWEVKVLSPDAAEPQFNGLSMHGSVCEFTLGRIDHYTVVTLSAKPEAVV